MKTDIVEGKYLIIVGGVMKKFNMLINLIIVFGAGVFVESLFAAYRDFINHPEVYKMGDRQLEEGTPEYIVKMER